MERASIMESGVILMGLKLKVQSIKFEAES
jgi:hypothetical protein